MQRSSKHAEMLDFTAKKTSSIEPNLKNPSKQVVNASVKLNRLGDLVHEWNENRKTVHND
jgi:hypothetical protein